MARKRFTTEQIIGLLREAEVRLSQGQAIGTVCRGIGVSQQSYYRWRREYGGLKLDQAKRFKDLERENDRLKKAVSELTLDKLILKEARRGKCMVRPVRARDVNRMPRAVCVNVSGLSRVGCGCSQAMMRSARVVPT